MSTLDWEGEVPSILRKGGQRGLGRGMTKSISHDGAGSGRGRGMTKVRPKQYFTLSQNRSWKKPLGDIELLHTGTLIKEVEKVFSASPPDPIEMEKARKLLREHEQALINAIAQLEDASDGESSNN